ncbi:Transcriptional regulator, AraC family [Synechocystis sp. PCC 6714]|nr:Transcriptional regulator, AraC family [Synechocystis sp. PCC 6714]
MEDPYAFLPRHQVFAFLLEAAQREGIEDLGWLVGERTELEELHAFGRLISQATTLYEAIAIAIRFMGIFNSQECLWLGENGDRAWFGQQFKQINEDSHHASHFSLTLMLKLIRRVAGQNWHPQEAYLQTPYLGKIGNFSLSQARIETQQGISAIIFPRRLLSLPLSPLNETDHDSDHKLLLASVPPLSFTDSLQQAIAPLLKERYPSVQLAANLSQMSVRTLQRRLAEEQFTYSQLVTRLRYQKALQLVGESQIKIIDIAFELGYQDAAHFTRAFKQWTGMSPHRFRQLFSDS